MYERYLLVAYFMLVNLIAAGLTVAAYFQGWLDSLVYAHLAELSGLICLVFAYGMVLAGFKIFQTSRQLNDVADGRPAADSPAGIYLAAVAREDARGADRAQQVLRLTLSNGIVVVRHFANALVFLGLIGTVVGFIIALSGVDPDAASDAAKVGNMVATLINGMSVALNTTLVGSVLYVWLIVNHRILASGTVRLLTAAMTMPAQAQGLPGVAEPQAAE